MITSLPPEPIGVATLVIVTMIKLELFNRIPVPELKTFAMLSPPIYPIQLLPKPDVDIIASNLAYTTLCAVAANQVILVSVAPSPSVTVLVVVNAPVTVVGLFRFIRLLELVIPLADTVKSPVVVNAPVTVVGLFNAIAVLDILR